MRSVQAIIHIFNKDHAIFHMSYEVTALQPSLPLWMSYKVCKQCLIHVTTLKEL